MPFRRRLLGQQISLCVVLWQLLLLLLRVSQGGDRGGAAATGWSRISHSPSLLGRRRGGGGGVGSAKPPTSQLQQGIKLIQKRASSSNGDDERSSADDDDDDDTATGNAQQPAVGFFQEWHVVTVLRPRENSSAAASSSAALEFASFLIPRSFEQPNAELSVHQVASPLAASNHDDHRDALLETLAWMSDAIVLQLDASHNSVYAGLVSALQAGFERRRSQNTTKSHLMVVLRNGPSGSKEGGGDPNDMEEWQKQQLVLSSFSAIQPTAVQTFELVTLPEAQTSMTLASLVGLLLQQQLQGATGDESKGVLLDIATPQGFARLLEQIQQSLSSPDEERRRRQPLRLQTSTSTTSLDQPIFSLFHNDEEKDDSMSMETEDVLASSSEEEQEQQVLAWATQQLADLQALQEESWLGMTANSSDDGSGDDDFAQRSLSTIMDFGTPASTFLDDLFVRLQTLPSAKRKKRVEQQVGHQLRDLYQQDLQHLRNVLGMEYERLLDRLGAQVTEAPELRPQMEQQLQHAALQLSQHFRDGAVQAIPDLAKPGNVFRDMDLEYASVLQGLLSDVQASTELWVLDHPPPDAMEVAEDDPARPKVKSWYRKLGGRVIVLAVNYLQGWLAWKGIQRAALERERRIPKFPIF